MKIIFNKSENRNGFVGIKYGKDNLTIYLPYGFEIENINDEVDEIDSELKNKLSKLLNSISIVNSIERENEVFGSSTGDEIETPFNSFIWIINDYLNNGFYTEIEKIYKQNSNGKINWKKTLNSEHYFEDDNIVFTQPYYENIMESNTVITELNKYCLEVSIKYVGFLFGNIEYEKSKLYKKTVEAHIDYYIKILNKVLSKTFNDRKKILINHIKRILKFTYDGLNKNSIDFGTYKYYYVWEYMIDVVFGSKNVNKKEFFPDASWTVDGIKEKDKSQLRPDTILKNNDELFILDAKYYKFGVTNSRNDLPNVSSIQKQITYGDHVINNLDFIPQNVYNAFILPYKSKDEKNIIYRGYAESNWNVPEGDKPYEKISLILLDFEYLFNKFYDGSKPDLDLLMKEIRKSQ
ncbi:MAG: LlaJI family restriction endonuclease [Bacilli bacterium]|nr:LlaJI family restriction endonuclease [Bacilli bacterium]